MLSNLYGDEERRVGEREGKGSTVHMESSPRERLLEMAEIDGTF